jgi:hypothetical protein
MEISSLTSKTRIEKTFVTVAVTVGLVLGGLGSCAILSHYAGRVDVMFGVDGGRLVIDGRPSRNQHN